MSIGIIGLGFVGDAINKSLQEHKIKTKCYDKYKAIGIIDDCLDTDMIFLCLPTTIDISDNTFEKSAIYTTCDYLKDKYKGLIILKSTVETGYTKKLSKQFNINIVHNPEYLSAKTAYQDFHNQSHIMIGIVNGMPMALVNLYMKYYTKNITMMTSDESETAKLFCNAFYATKIQFFTEMYLYCKKNKLDYDYIKTAMLENKWINPMHTNVPGHDGNISYGGACFPKDTTALLTMMKSSDTPHKVLDAVINERNSMRKYLYK